MSKEERELKAGQMRYFQNVYERVQRIDAKCFFGNLKNQLKIFTILTK
jgi:hypothetical protein